MTISGSELRPTTPPLPPPHRMRWVWVIVGLVGAVALGLGLLVRFAAWTEGGSLPSFPSLAAAPDPLLHGTVAYYADETGCIRLAAASGATSRTLWCLPRDDASSWPTVGKPVGPQLVWRSDGRLEVTMFRMDPTAQKGMVLKAGWQKLVDVRTGDVEDVLAADVPSTPNAATEPIVAPDGRRVEYTLDGGSGRVKVILTDAAGTARTLLSAHGPGNYGYRFGPVFWAPNGQWIAASDDGRILVITPGTPSTTRVLVTHSGGGAGGGTAGPAFAVTSADLLG